MRQEDAQSRLSQHVWEVLRPAKSLITTFTYLTGRRAIFVFIQELSESKRNERDAVNVMHVQG